MKKIAFFLMALLVCSLGLTLGLLAQPARPAAAQTPEPPPDLPPLEAVAELSDGWAYLLTIQGQYAYVQMDSHLLVLDISQPAHPTVVGKSKVIQRSLIDIALAGQHVYLLNDLRYDTWLEIVDVSDPTRPIVAAPLSLPGEAKGLAVAGDYAYLATGAGLSIFNVSNPLSPTLVAAYQDILARNVTVSDGDVYIVARGDLSSSGSYDENILIFDDADPIHFSTVGQNLHFGGSTLKDFIVDGKTIYLLRSAIEDIDFPMLESWEDRPLPAAQPAGDEESATLEESPASSADYMLSYLLALDISDPSTVTLMSKVRLRSTYENLALHGHYLYIDGIIVMNVSNPSNPIQTGPYRFGPDAADVDFVGEYAYMAYGYDGLRVFDVSDPSILTQIGSYDLPDQPLVIEAADDYVYILDSAPTSWDFSFHTMALSDLSLPAQVGTYDIEALDMAVSNSRAYLIHEKSDNFFGSVPFLSVIDVSSPLLPSLLDEYRTRPTSSYMLAVQANYAYVADGQFGGLHIVDLSDPASPREAGYHHITGTVHSVAVTNTYVYVANDSSLLILDVANPLQPLQLSRHRLQSTITSLVLSGRYAYLTQESYVFQDDAWIGGLRILDISDPAQPVEVGHYVPEGVTSDGRPHGAERVLIRGQYAYVASKSAGLRIVDVADPAHPVEVGVYDAPQVKDVLVDGHYAYLSNDDKVLILDVAQPAQPAQVGEYDPGERPISSLALTQHMLFVSHGLKWEWEEDAVCLHILDISDPTQPITLTSNSVKEPINQIVIKEDYAYLTMGTRGLWVMDISDLAHINRLGVYDQPGRPSSILVRGQYAYIATHSHGLRILDISDPHHITEAGIYRTSHVILSMSLSGNSLYLLTSGKGIEIVDLSNPIAPVKVGHISVAAACVEAIGPYVLVCRNAPAAVALIDAADPAQPVELSSYQVGVELQDIAVAGQYVYVMDWLGNINNLYMHVLDFSNLLQPELATSYQLPGSLAARSLALHRQLTLHADLIFARSTALRWPGVESVAGHITDPSGRFVPGAWISSGRGLGAGSDTHGLYSAHLISGTYTLTPSLSGYTFWPPTHSVSLPGQVKPLDFVALQAFPSVSVTLAPSGTAWLTQTLTYTDRQSLPTQLIFAPGVVSRTTTLVFTPIQAIATGEWAFAGHAFDLAAYQAGQVQPDFAFSRPVSLSLRYSQADMQSIAREDQLALLWWDGDSWSPATDTCAPTSVYQRDLVNNSLGLAICRTGRYALFGPTHRVYLPLISVLHSSRYAGRLWPGAGSGMSPRLLFCPGCVDVS